MAQLAEKKLGWSFVMKLLFVNSSLSDGGSEKAMTLVANQMANLGHDVSMLLIRNKEVTYEPDSRIDVIQLSYTAKSKIGMLCQRLKLIRFYVKKISPDCLITFMWDVNVMTLIAAMGLSVKKVVSERAYPGSPERSVVSKIAPSIFYTFADHIVYQTNQASEFCPKRLKRKAVVIPNIVSVPPVKPFSGKRSKRVVSVGRLTRQKNFTLLIQAFALFSSCYEDYVLEIYGEGEQRETLERFADSLGLSSKVRFCGFAKDVLERINDASVFVLSSDYEGISNAMAEAMALGLPVVCTDCPVGGASMMIQNGVNGILVDVGDKNALAAAMCDIAGNQEKSLGMSERSKEVVKRFSAETVGKQWEGVLTK